MDLAVSTLDLPQFCQGHGQEAWVTERDQMGAGVEEYSTPEIFTTLRGKAT